VIGDIDSTLPVGMTHLIDRADEICQQHGGVVTAIRYDSLEEMDLDKFLKERVPNLKENRNNLVIIKDTVRQNMYRILNDNVAIYHIKEISDVFIDAFMERLANEQAFSVTLNLTYPLIHFATTKYGEKLICVSIPEKQFTYHVSDRGFEPFLAWHPPLWFYLKLNPANIPQNVKIGVVLDRSDDAKKATVCHLPLPNCYPDGNICFGGTHLTNPNGGALTEAAAIELKYQQLFNSNFNSDLLQDREIQQIEAMCKARKDWPECEKELNNFKNSFQARFAIRYKYAFMERASVFKFQYRNSRNGEDFLAHI
jgi:hypothetical protein